MWDNTPVPLPHFELTWATPASSGRVEHLTCEILQKSKEKCSGERGYDGFCWVIRWMELIWGVSLGFHLNQDMDFYCQCLSPCLVQRKCSRNSCWINEWKKMNGRDKQLRARGFFGRKGETYYIWGGLCKESVYFLLCGRNLPGEILSKFSFSTVGLWVKYLEMCTAAQRERLSKYKGLFPCHGWVCRDHRSRRHK